MSQSQNNYLATIGIECHVQLKTRTKLFSGADNDARSAAPNTTVSPICFGLPGTLPVLNAEAVNLAVRAAAALNAEVASVSSFDRKHYFYPDLPKGYQITQLERPTVGQGSIDVPLPDGQSITVRITRAHIEEDAGKLLHPEGGNFSLVDLNRAGTPLIEIVSEPDMHTPEEARAYASELHRLMTYAGVTYGNLYHGNMRFDVNISVAKKDADILGARAEIKNLNSFRSVEKAAEYEFKRQVELLEKGEVVAQETRGWNDDTQTTFSQRSKEDAHDYRYMPDPDIPPIVLSDQEIKRIQQQVPLLPPAYRQQFGSLGVDPSVIQTILDQQPLADMVAQVLKKDTAAARRVANWIASDLKLEADATVTAIPPIEDLLTLATMSQENQISSNAASQLFNQLMGGATDPRALAEQQNLLQVSDEGAIAAIVDDVLADPASQKAVEDIKAGNDKAIGFLVGQIMKKSQGKANPGLAQKLIRERL